MTFVWSILETGSDRVLATVRAPASMHPATSADEHRIKTQLRNEFATRYDAAAAIEATDLELPFIEWLVAEKGFRRI